MNDLGTGSYTSPTERAAERGVPLKVKGIENQSNSYLVGTLT